MKRLESKEKKWISEKWETSLKISKCGITLLLNNGKVKLINVNANERNIKRGKDEKEMTSEMY